MMRGFTCQNDTRHPSDACTPTNTVGSKVVLPSMPTTRAAVRAANGAGGANRLLDLPPELVRHVLTQLELEPFFVAGACCKLLHETTHDPRLLASLPLEPVEPAAFEPQREHLLRRLADAGNGAACYRLGIAYAYHPRPTQERPTPLEDSAAMLRRAMEVGGSADQGGDAGGAAGAGRGAGAATSAGIDADAAYELWLLTRRLPAAAASSESLLTFAAANGHSPARFAAHRSRSSAKRPGDFVTSAEFATAQSFLVEAFKEAPLDSARFSVCRNPACGRWGVRAREVRRRSDAGFPALQAPPGLPRCQGMHGQHCRTRYCSRYCQGAPANTHCLEPSARTPASLEPVSSQPNLLIDSSRVRVRSSPLAGAPQGVQPAGGTGGACATAAACWRPPCVKTVSGSRDGL